MTLIMNKEELKDLTIGVVVAALEIKQTHLLKEEIKRVNQVLRETHNPREFKQNKKYLERLERKLRSLTRKER